MSAPTPRSIADLDVSVAVLQAEIAQAHTSHDEHDELAFREALFLVQHPEVRVSVAADYPNWVPPHTDPAEDFARSVRDGFEPPIDWTVDPPESTRLAPGPVCEPEFSHRLQRTVADVETGGLL